MHVVREESSVVDRPWHRELDGLEAVGLVRVRVRVSG
jgi:hypothetical protein